MVPEWNTTAGNALYSRLKRQFPESCSRFSQTSPAQNSLNPRKCHASD